VAPLKHGLLEQAVVVEVEVWQRGPVKPTRQLQVKPLEEG